MKKLKYKGLGGADSICAYEIYQGESRWAGKDVVVIYELPENKGTSITNWIENLIRIIQKKVQLKDPLFLEFYKTSGYSIVDIEDGKPDWKFINPTFFRNNVGAKR